MSAAAEGDRHAVRIVLHGSVQGVWMRAWIVEQARALGLDGWVRNRADGTVEAFATGPEQVLQELVLRCGRGSPASRVDRVEVAFEAAGDAIAPGFVQRPTV